MGTFRYLGLGDFLAIAVVNTNFDARDLADNDAVIARAQAALWAPTSAAYADPVAKAAILEYALIRNRPLPDSNVIVAHECMKEFAWRNGFSFDRELDDNDPDDLFRAIISGDPDALDRLTAWLKKTLVER